MTWHGITTVARQEFTLRIRAGRWRWLLTIWFGLVSGFTVLTHLAVRASYEHSENKGVVVYGALVIFVLALALLVVPSLTGQSVNGDRERGTLATLQVTRLSALEIALGKLASAWGTALVFLALALPAVAYSAALGGVPIGRVLVVTVVVGLLLGVFAAVALCLSSLLSRTTTSGVLSYVSVFAATAGTLIAFGIGAAISTEHYTEQSTCPSRTELLDSGIPEAEIDRFSDCTASTYESTRTRTDRIWWLLAPNPFVIVADAAPQLPKETEAERRARLTAEQSGIYRNDLRDSDPLGAIGRGVRDLRKPPEHRDAERKAVWPYGLAFDVLVGAGAVWVAARRLRAPSRVLPRGQRVA